MTLEKSRKATTWFLFVGRTKRYHHHEEENVSLENLLAVVQDQSLTGRIFQKNPDNLLFEATNGLAIRAQTKI